MKENTVKDLMDTLTKLLNEGKIQESNTLFLTHSDIVIIKQAGIRLLAFTERRN